MTRPAYVKYVLPQYGLGSWLQENAGTVGSLVGAGIGTLIAPGIGTSIGAQLGGQAGGLVQNGYMQDQQQLEADKQQSITQAINQYQAKPNPMYGANFANGGILNSYQCGGKMMACGGKMKANGGMVEAANGLDNVTVYANGGTHQTNPNGGITIGNRGQVEQGEVRYKDYIFSNRF